MRQSLILYCRCNRHTGVRFTDVPAPVPQLRSELQPDFPPWRNALTVLTRLYKAFRKFSNNFQIEFVRIAPLLGDFKIVYFEDGVKKEIIVEMKSGHCHISGFPEWKLVHQQASLGYTNRRVFTWKAKWDYIFTIIDSKQALMIPRDEIPSEWWNVTILPGRPYQLIWPAGKPFTQYAIDLTSRRRSVRDIEKILQRRKREKDSMRAQIPIDMSIDTDADDIDEQDLSLDSMWSSSGFQRGFGSPLHDTMRGATYEVWASEVLLEMCRQR